MLSAMLLFLLLNCSILFGEHREIDRFDIFGLSSDEMVDHDQEFTLEELYEEELEQIEDCLQEAERLYQLAEQDLSHENYQSDKYILSSQKYIEASDLNDELPESIQKNFDEILEEVIGRYQEKINQSMTLSDPDEHDRFLLQMWYGYKGQLEVNLTNGSLRAADSYRSFAEIAQELGSVDQAIYFFDKSADLYEEGGDDDSSHLMKSHSFALSSTTASPVGYELSEDGGDEDEA